MKITKPLFTISTKVISCFVACTLFTGVGEGYAFAASSSPTSHSPAPTSHRQAFADAQTRFPATHYLVTNAGRLSSEDVARHFSSYSMQLEMQELNSLTRNEGEERFWPIVILAGEALITFATTVGLRAALTAAVRAGYAAFNSWLTANPGAGVVLGGFVGAAVNDVYNYIKGKLT